MWSHWYSKPVTWKLCCSVSNFWWVCRWCSPRMCMPAQIWPDLCMEKMFLRKRSWLRKWSRLRNNAVTRGVTVVFAHKCVNPTRSFLFQVWKMSLKYASRKYCSSTRVWQDYWWEERGHDQYKIPTALWRAFRSGPVYEPKWQRLVTLVHWMMLAFAALLSDYHGK